MKMNNEWNIDFLQNSPLGIQNIHSSEFSISQSISETPILILYEVLAIYFFSIFPIFKSYFWDKSSV